jgi:hypothetical protein
MKKIFGFGYNIELYRSKILKKIDYFQLQKLCVVINTYLEFLKEIFTKEEPFLRGGVIKYRLN